MISLALQALAVVACAVAAVACATTGRRSRSRGWLAVGAGAAAAGLAIAWRLLAGEAATPVPAAIGISFLATALVLLGVLGLHGAPTGPAARARTLVDGLIVAGSALLIGWVAGLDATFERADDTEALAFAVAVAELAVASAVLVMVTRARPAAALRLALLAAGLGAVAMADSAIAYLALDGQTDPAGALYLASAAGWALVACSAFASGRPPTGDELVPGLPGHISVLIPSIPFAGAIFASAIAAAGGEFRGFLVWNGAAVILLIVVRQISALVENITYWQRLEAKVEARNRELRRSEARFRALVQNASDVVTVVGPNGKIRYQSPSTRQVLGYEPAELSGAPPLQLVHPDDVARVLGAAAEISAEGADSMSLQFRFLHQDGGWRHLEAITANLLHDEDVGAYVVNTRDVTEHKALEQQLAFQAFHDPLTELPNRALFVDRVEHALHRSLRSTNHQAVLFLDLDDFKRVNDSFGHGAGDALLRVVARKLTASVRPGDTVARLGGDEFAVLVEELEDAAEAEHLANRILESFEVPFEVSGRRVLVSASIGISTGFGAVETAEEVLRTADIAMYAAKGKKGSCEVFRPGMDSTIMDRLNIEDELRRALERGELELHYQPIVSLDGQGIGGVEALVRWRHPDRGTVGPGRFIPVAEESGLIVPIGRWVVREACLQAQRWREAAPRHPPITMGVNLSVRQLQDPGLLADVTAGLHDSGLLPQRLVVEVTESLVMDEADSPARAHLDGLRELGVRVAIDDFGTGYSSLSYLRRLPVDILKIDRAFVGGIAPGTPGSAVAEAIVTMGESLGLLSVAEGVERPQEARELKRIGCLWAQGNHFVPPASAEAIGRLLADPRGTAEAMASARRAANGEPAPRSARRGGRAS